jgi:hypothetical protein
MRQRAIIGALLLIVLGVALGATVFRTDIAHATGLAGPTVTVDNTAANPVPVREQGTVNVNVTNSGLSVAPPAPVTDGANSILVDGGETQQVGASQGVATALSIRLTSGVEFVQFYSPDGNEVPAVFAGPAQFGNSSIELALTRPIRFGLISCPAAAVSDHCRVSWVGGRP